MGALLEVFADYYIHCPDVRYIGNKLLSSKLVTANTSTLQLNMFYFHVLRIDMYVGGTTDLMETIIYYPFIQPEQKEGHLNKILHKAKNRYFPVYEKILRDHGEKYLVGNRFSWADVHLLEAILMVEEKGADILTHFPLLKGFKTRISEIPTIKAFLQPGSQRKPVPGEKYVQTVRTVLQMYHTVSPN